MTPVYWIPSGKSIPANYRQLINQFISDVANDSGTTTNVFSSVMEYTNRNSVALRYLIHAGTPITDTNPFPTGGCTPDVGSIWSDGTAYSACITNAQLLTEASAFTTAQGLPRDMAHLYMYFLPKGLETCFGSANGAGGGVCSLNAGNPSSGFCGYHAFEAPPLVANMNYAFVDAQTGYTCSSDGGSNTGGNQSPNANIDADTEISVTSHEIIEAMTDPEGTGWYDRSGNEIADDCGYIYGDSASFQGSAGARYNQVINGHQYFIQLELSNANFAVNSSQACIQHEPNRAPSINSAPSAQFRVGRHGSYKVKSLAIPVAALSESGSLPTGLTFVDNHDGTANIAGTPAFRAGGRYRILIGVNNGVAPAAGQNLTLTVKQAPVFRSASSASFTHGVKRTFQITAVGPPLPGKISKAGALPPGITFSSTGGGKGVLTGTAAASAKGKHFVVTFTVSNSLGTAKQKFTLSVT